MTVESLGGMDVSDYAVRLFKEWGIGEKDKNNGVLFLIAPNDRRTRIEVGYGLEPVLSDARTGRLLDDHVIPYFRTGDFPNGIMRGSFAIASTIAVDANVSLSGIPIDIRRAQPVHLSAFQALLVFLVILVIVFFVLRNPWLFFFMGPRGGGGGWGGGGFGGGGFGGFGGGMSGGGGASRGW